MVRRRLRRELHLALRAGFAPERLVLHGNAKSEAELRVALRHRVGLIVIDNLDELDCLERCWRRASSPTPAAAGARAGDPQRPR